MNQQEATQYLDAVMQGKIQLQGAEQGILQRLRQVNLESLQTEKEISSLSALLDKTRIHLHTLSGQREGYATVLVDAEVARKSAKTPTDVDKVHDLNETERKTLTTLLGMDVDRAELHAVKN